ncbi:SDR family oxidoreductase [Actinomadura madurae]|uniref:SDR family NAD(P)-dependent oxidoreductase n=1 Tax=Actinomadura madurae TaxID=1993 RepID=UPI002025EBDA|nr:SDR family oxidoreductase [Actinomadura madurae]URM93961.1 SDR family oxidoreductase [Actinomadura madurae]
MTELRQDVRTVVVVGGSGGIGGAIAQAFAGEPDTTVIATAATEAELEQARVDPRLTNVDLRHLDVRSDDGVGDLMAGIGRLDVLVNAAGVPAGPKDFEIDGFVRTIEVNLVGTARASYAAYPLLRAARGSVINLASVMSFRGSATGPAYAASKGGVVQLTKSLAAAWAPEVRVNAIAPGFIDTPMTANIRGDAARNDRILERTPAGRWGRPDEIADAATFLASAAANFVNGTVLAVDGGYLAL